MDALKALFDISTLVGLAFTVATPIILFYVIKYARIAAAKAHLELTAEQEAQLQALAKKAIVIVEEKAKNRLKATNVAVPGVEKLGQAIDIVKHALPGTTTAAINEAIHAKLPEFRAEVSLPFGQAIVGGQ